MAQVQTIRNSDIQSRSIKSHLIFFRIFGYHYTNIYLQSAWFETTFVMKKCYPFNVVVDVKE